MDAPSKPAWAGGRNLPLAIVSGAALAAVVLGTLAWSPYAFLLVIAVLVGAAVYELDTALRAHGLRPATGVVGGTGLVMVLGAYEAGGPAQSVGLVLLLVGAVVWAVADRAHPRVVESLAATILMGVWVPFLVSFVGLLLVRENGAWLVAMTLALSGVTDIGAYAWGSRLGRRKLAPSVSPGKTWEGVLGAVATALVAGAAASALTSELPLSTALGIAAVVAVASTLGDLAESAVKRDLGVKDLGRIIPGHGGIMDRADGAIVAIPAVHLLLLALGQ